MPWSGGTYSRVHDWTDDRDAGLDIDAVRFDQENDDFTTGINACLERSGSNSMSGDLNAGSNKVINVTDPTAAQDAATKAYVDANTDVFASGDDLFWRGASTPTGWVIQAIDDKAVKIVSGATGSGGTNAFSVGLNTALSITGGSHTHADTFATGASANVLVQTGVNASVAQASHTHTVTGSVTTSASHTHSKNIDVQFESFNIIQKS